MTNPQNFEEYSHEKYYANNATKAYRLGIKPYLAPKTIWNTKNDEEYSSMNASIVQCGFHLFCAKSRRDALRFSLRAALEIASVPIVVTPSYVPDSLSVTPDGSLVSSATPLVFPRKVLYLNTLCSSRMLENEWVGLFPDVENWLANPRGRRHPLADLPMEVVDVPVDMIIKDFDRLDAHIAGGKFTCLIINSFEFAISTERYKRELIHHLKELNELRGITIIMVSNVPQRRIEPKATGPYADLHYLSSCVKTIPYTSLESLPDSGVTGAPVEDIFSTGRGLCDVVLTHAENSGCTVHEKARGILNEKAPDWHTTGKPLESLTAPPLPPLDDEEGGVGVLLMA